MSSYDEIGVGYARTRQPDPRIADRILAALGDSDSVVNVGAGTGSYEPRDRRVVAVEPSITMLDQRAPLQPPAVRGIAERLPFATGSFDASLAVLTAHHWSDAARGFREMRRVTRDRVVVLTWDQEVFERFWLLSEYLPCLRAVDRPRAVPIPEIEAALEGARVLPVPIPHDCVDGFLGAFWRRPEAYLDPGVRAGISACVEMPADEGEEGIARLAADLESGAWADRHRDLTEREELDLGYRLVVAWRDEQNGIRRASQLET